MYICCVHGTRFDIGLPNIELFTPVQSYSALSRGRSVWEGPSVRCKNKRALCLHIRVQVPLPRHETLQARAKCSAPFWVTLNASGSRKKLHAEIRGMATDH